MPPNVSDITPGDTINAPADPVWTGNIFQGWYDSGLTTQYTFPLPITSNITLYDKWQYTAKEVWDYQDFGDYAAAPITKTISSPTDFTNAKTDIEANAGNYVINITSTVDVGNADINLAEDSNISLRGGGTLHKSSGADGPLFSLINANTKLVLRDANLKGFNSNKYALVYLDNSSALFDMLGGTISGNKGGYGGGVYVGYGSFTMKDGTIYGNTSSADGGGVFVHTANGATFAKTGGTIYGSDGGANANTAGSGNGHAVGCNSGGKYRDTTAGETIDLNSDTTDNWGQ